MNAVCYHIKGGDFENDGAASRSVKEQLKKVGADPAVIRRAMVAAYEAEMNVVIHAHHGELRASLHDGQLDVEVIDQGPGISDVELAMKPGYSTASAEARQLGFGAGMGLPNIKKNSDKFAIESTVGQGTRISFTIYLKPQALYGVGRHSLRIAAEACKQSLNCIRVCPTQALRIFRGKPQLLDYLCIDCAACTAICPNDVFGVSGLSRESGAPPSRRCRHRRDACAMVGMAEPTATEWKVPADCVLVLPSPCLVQFGAGVSPPEARHVLAELGFVEVRSTGPWEDALRVAVLEYAKGSACQAASRGLPIVSPTCPAIINLIETKFPALIPIIAPFVSAIEAAHAGLGGKRVMSVILCPCQQTALISSDSGVKPETILPSVIRSAALSRLKAKQGTACGEETRRSLGGAAGTQAGLGPEERPAGLKPGALLRHDSLLRVTGLRHVVNVLEAVEDGLIGDVAVLELYACDEGCFGSPLLAEEPFVARHRWEQGRSGSGIEGQAVRRGKPYSPRPGLRLDADMARAIAKLAKIDKLARSLPGCDCGICGAPTCAALAEDIVLGRATREACLREQQDRGREDVKPSP